MYKKAERLGKALYLISPAFADSLSLKNRLDSISLNLVDAALLPPLSARTALSRELLALSSILSIARTGGLLSHMNSELITREAQLLLQEVASYEAPRLTLDETPTLSSIARHAFEQGSAAGAIKGNPAPERKGHIKDNVHVPEGTVKDRREAVLSVIRNKGQARIKDISMIIRGVSEKTIQRELLALIAAGIIRKEGERRWSRYHLAS